jgi:hypothetical protein
LLSIAGNVDGYGDVDDDGDGDAMLAVDGFGLMKVDVDDFGKKKFRIVVSCGLFLSLIFVPGFCCCCWYSFGGFVDISVLVRCLMLFGLLPRMPLRDVEEPPTRRNFSSELAEVAHRCLLMAF